MNIQYLFAAALFLLPACTAVACEEQVLLVKTLSFDREKAFERLVSKSDGLDRFEWGVLARLYADQKLWMPASSALSNAFHAPHRCADFVGFYTNDVLWLRLHEVYAQQGNEAPAMAALEEARGSFFAGWKPGDDEKEHVFLEWKSLFSILNAKFPY